MCSVNRFEQEKVSVCLLLAASESMTGCFEYAKRAAGLVIRMARCGDRFAVIGYSDEAWSIYPKSAEDGMVTVDQEYDLTERAYQAIAEQNTYDMANMGDGILVANDLLQNETSRGRAYMVVCDKYANMGAQPERVVRADIPVAVCGLGIKRASDFQPLLSRNKGSRLCNTENAQDICELYQMAFETWAVASGGEILVNKTRRYADGSDYAIEKFDVTASETSYQVAVAWSDATYYFTDGMPEGCGINVILMNPQNEDIRRKPDITGEGYCIFNLAGLEVGTWRLLVQYTAEGLRDSVTVIRYCS